MLSHFFKINPFEVFPPHLDAVFVEREYIKQGLEIFDNSLTLPIPSEKINVLFWGSKGMGKTTMLQYVKDTYASKLHPLWIVSLPATEKQCLEKIAEELLDDVQKGFIERPIQCKKKLNDSAFRTEAYDHYSAFANSEIARYRSFIHFIDFVTSHSKKQLGIFVDESSSLGRQTTQSEDLRIFLCTLLPHPEVTFFINMLPKPFNIIKNDPVFDRFGCKVCLRPFTLDETHNLLRKRIERNIKNGLKPPAPPYPLEAGLVETLNELGDANPRRMLEIARSAFNNAVKNDEETISLGVLEAGADAAFPQLELILDTTTLQLPPLKKMIFDCLVRYNQLTSSELSDKLGKHRPSISRALKEMMNDKENEIIIKEGRYYMARKLVRATYERVSGKAHELQSWDGSEQ